MATPDLETLIATLGPGAAQTIAQNPQGTIRPRMSSIESSERAAIEALIALRDGAPLRLQGTLGEGGMGVVHLADQVSVGRSVAVKTLREDAARPEEAGFRLLQEGWVTGGLEHPNVVPVYDVNVDEEGRPRIVLKRIDGLLWSDVMFDEETIEATFGHSDALEWNLGILEQVCDALHFAHSQGIVHRDIKPENVMIGHFGETYLLDWGIAVAMADDGTGRLPLAAQATQMAGTPNYMAPEMLGQAPHKLSPRTDVYLLGAVLYEIVCEEPPHVGSSTLAILGSVLQSRVQVPPRVDVELAALCQRAMAREPEDRFEDADAFRKALHTYLSHRDSIRLTQQAGAELEALREAIAEGEGGAIMARYGGAIFGYLRALDRWPGNHAAADGLVASRTAMIDYRLEVGDARGARENLEQFTAPPAELVARVEAAEVEAEARSHHIARLEALDANLDLEVGSRTRAIVTLILGSVWTFFPLTHFWAKDPSFTRLTIRILWVTVMVTTVLWWKRDWLRRTTIDRRIMGAIYVALMLQFASIAAGALVGAPALWVQASWLLLWAATTSMLALCVEPRLWPAAIGYVLAFVSAASTPSLTFLFMSLGNALLTLNALYLWAPRPTSASR